MPHRCRPRPGATVIVPAPGSSGGTPRRLHRRRPRLAIARARPRILPSRYQPSWPPPGAWTTRGKILRVGGPGEHPRIAVIEPPRVDDENLLKEDIGFEEILDSERVHPAIGMEPVPLKSCGRAQGSRRGRLRQTPLGLVPALHSMNARRAGRWLRTEEDRVERPAGFHRALPSPLEPLDRLLPALVIEESNLASRVDR